MNSTRRRAGAAGPMDRLAYETITAKARIDPSRDAVKYLTSPASGRALIH
jgi:hypothetical protein